MTPPGGAPEQRSVPDETSAKKCSAGLTTGCWAWEAGAELLTQAADPTKFTAATPDFGLDLTDGTKRRVFYTVNQWNFTNPPATTPPWPRLFFQYSSATDQAHWTDLLAGMGLCNQLDNICGALPTNQAAAKLAVQFTLKPKSFIDPSTAQAVPYILGDIFHSDPVVTGDPRNFRFFANDLFVTTQKNSCGYRCFFNQNQFRRKMVLVGANDGMLHAFDAGLPGKAGTTPDKWVFDNGTGHEIFAYVPRPVLPTLDAQAIADANQTASQQFMVDGGTVVSDVYIDPAPGDGSGTGAEWRTVAIGGLREGGSGYYALDITQPDILIDDHLTPGLTTSPAVKIPQPLSGGYVPSCMQAGTSGCGRLPFPSVLWEFTDSCLAVPTCTSGCKTIPCDEDANGQPDLGTTWSTANIGRIRVCTTADCNPAFQVDKFVAIFGGGMDPAKANSRGNFLYMVDIETGKVLYKRQVTGSVPSEPAAVDTNQSGYLNTVYFGTTAGFLYKVDMTSPAPLKAIAGVGTRIDPTFWQPLKIFDTESRPIYFPPAVVFVTQLGRYALAFGTGDRENLWATPAIDPSTGQPLTGRFFTILDTGFTSATPGLPFKAANFTKVTPTGAANAATNLLVQPADVTKQNGWFLELASGERVVDKTFSLSGVTVFSSYQPSVITAQAASGSGTVVCADTGKSNIWVVNTTNADALGTSGTARFHTVNDFVNSPFTEPGLTKNAPSNGDTTGAGTDAQELTAQLQAIQNQLRTMFPSNCKFANYTINIKAVRSDTGLEFIAPVPVCMIEKNWKEF